MLIHFILPDINHLVTGGNVYNQMIIEKLPPPFSIRSLIINKKLQNLEELNLARLNVTDEKSVILIDSYLLRLPQIREMLIALSKNHFLILIVHYLKVLDLSKKNRTDLENEKSLFTFFNGFITTSDFSRSSLIGTGIPSNKIGTVRPGISSIFGNTENLEKKRPVKILTVSSFTAGKGLLEFFKILEEISNIEWIWHIVGENNLDVSFYHHFSNFYNQSQIKDRVSYSGALDQKALARVYQESDIFVLPSEFESCSMVTMEAMASGLPVVAYHVGGLSELIENGKSGYLIPKNNKNKLAMVLKELVTNEKLRQRLADAGKLKSDGFSSWDDAAQNFVRQLYRFINTNH